jgi:MoaA/NifB/PqqE/SkfB family radical SAM enzyme
MTAGNPDVKTPAGIAANLSIELTTRCTSACRHCFARAGLPRDVCLSLDSARSICEEGFAAGFRHLHLSGGEPLLWNGLWDLLDDVFVRGYRSVFMNTNGLLMTAPVVDRLAQYPGLRLSVSLEGPESLHDRIRGAGTHRRTAQGVERALEAGLAMSIFTTVGKPLLIQLPAFVKEVYATFEGIEQLTLIQLIRPGQGAWDLAAELLDPDDFVTLVRMVSALNLCGLFTDLLNNPLANVAAAELGLPLVPQSHALCRPSRLMVRANQDITVAHSTPEIIGQYRPGMITRALTCDGYCKAVAQDDTTCPMCPYIGQCRKHGQLRPSPSVMDLQPEVPYCQRVLAGIEQSL